jgi:tRNA1Val (adenine37-N6)-methyltransferase
MPFSFKKFTIQDSNCAQKVGVDAVILGAWLQIGDPISILEVGGGSGIISLMLAQRTQKSEITSIEINYNAFVDLQNNFRNVPWSPRLEAIHADFFTHPFDQKFNWIVSNPPYFNITEKAISHERNQARNAANFPLQDFFNKSFDLLEAEGKLAVVYPYFLRQSWIKRAFLAGFYLDAELYIRDNPTSEFNRIVSVFSKNIPHQVSENTLILKDENDGFSSDYQNLTKDFYL